MEKKIKDQFSVGPEFSVTIFEDNTMTVSSVDAEHGDVTVQLANDAEAVQAMAEAKDESGELMYTEDAIFAKYEQLHQFRA